MVDLGYNYRIDEIRSALGLEQLGKLEHNNQLRRERSALYHALLAEVCPGVELPFRHHPGVSAGHLLPVLLPQGTRRAAIMEKMKSRGVQTSIHYPPIHQFQAYCMTGGRSPAGLVHTESLAERELTLPLYPAMTGEDVSTVVQAQRESLAELNVG